MKTITTLGLLVLLTFTAARAEITTTGLIASSVPQTSPVWDLGSGAITVGNATPEPSPGTLTMTNGAEIKLGILDLHTGTIEVLSGSSITFDESVNGYLGIGERGSALMTVRGSGSRVDLVVNDLNVGYFGNGPGGAHLLIEDGGYLRSGITTIGGISDNSITVTGTNSTWVMVSERVSVGGIVSGELTIADGGSAQIAGYISVGGDSIEGSGRVTVTGQGSSVEAASISIGYDGTFIVEDGAYVSTTGGIVVGGPARSGNLTVAGEGSILNASEIVMNQNSTFNIGTGGFAGTVLTPEINGYANGMVNFNHTDNITAAYALKGLLQVNKLGSGSTSLTAANTYNGGTVVSAGTFLANNLTGSAFGNGAVTVESGARIGGAGFIGGLTTIESGGRIAAGASEHTIGTLTFDAGLILENGSFLDFDLGATSDFLRITGGVFEVKGATLNFDSVASYAPGTYTLIDWTDANAGEFLITDFETGSFTLGEISDYSLEIVGTTLQLSVNAAAIPEPSAFAALAGVGALMLALRRRRPKSRR